MNSSLALPAARPVLDARALGAACDYCPLAKDRTPVPPAPSKSGVVRLVIIGEAPARLERLRGEPFVGRSGYVLDNALRAASFPRRDCHITNACLCEREDASDQEMAVAAACCAPRLARELAMLPPAAPLLVLGGVALKPILGRGAIKKNRGFIWRLPPIDDAKLRSAKRLLERKLEKAAARPKDRDAKEQASKARASLFILEARKLIEGRIAIASVHPAFLLRGADSWSPVFYSDVEKATRWASAGPQELEDEGSFVVTNDPKEIRRLLAKMRDTIEVDIETTARADSHDDARNPLVALIDCIGISDDHDGNGTTLVIFPWRRSLSPLVNAACKNRTVVGHNIVAFDEIALNRRGIKLPRIEDTIIAHHAFASHLPQSLAHVASVYTTSKAWKALERGEGEDEKGSGFGVKKENLARYCASDVRLGIRSWYRMQPDLEAERSIYERGMQMARLYQQMRLTGIHIDVERKEELSRRLKARASALLGEMRKMLRRPNFNPASVADLRRALFKQLRAPTWLAPPTSTGLPTTGAGVLEALKGGDSAAGILADLIIRWRSANTIRRKDLDYISIGKDGRIHPAWRGFSVETGRPSVHEPNVLNYPRCVLTDQSEKALKRLNKLPKEEAAPLRDAIMHDRENYQLDTRTREILVAAPGKVILYYDESQVEMRAAAHFSGDPVFIESCKGDVHVGNACALFPEAAEIIRADPKGAGKPFRDIAKSAGFAVSYLAEWEKVYSYLVSKGFNVTPERCQVMLEKLHRAYAVYYKYVEANVAFCQQHGYLRSPIHGRIRRLGFYPKPTTVANFPVQSGVADITNERLLEMEQRRPKNVRLIMYAYDSATYECDPSDVELMKRLIKEQWAVPVMVPHNQIEFVIPIDLKEGERFSDF